MKILQINCVYRNGSTGKIVFDIHTELQKQGFESIVCYGRGPKINEPNVYKTSSELSSKVNNLLTRFNGLMYSGCLFSTNTLISVIKKEKPDVVHLHCINGYFVNIYRLVAFLRDAGVKTVLTLHAEFMYTGNCGHALECEKWKTGCGNCPWLKKETKSLFIDRTDTSWKKMKDAFDKFDKDLIVASVSPWLMERAKQSPILADKHHCVVLNGIDAGVFHPYNTATLKEKHGLTDEKIIFHATAGFSSDPNHIKGGYYVLELAKMLINDNAKIIVAGTYDTSIESPENVIFLGRINDQNLLARYYSMADVTLLTSRKETFSMICAESLCCGTPVVGFRAGAPEQIAIPEYSSFVDFADLDSLKRETVRMLYRPYNYTIIGQDAKYTYANYKMANEYASVYRRLLK